VVDCINLRHFFGSFGSFLLNDLLMLYLLRLVVICLPTYVPTPIIYATLAVIDIDSMTITTTFELPGQPDSVDVSPVSGMYIAVAIENERDEDLGDGVPPQFPPGYLTIITMVDVTDPSTWTSVDVELTGLDGLLYPEDPEPEFVSINDDDICVVTLQENNGIVLVDLATATVIDSFSAGAVSLEQIDILEDLIITSDSSLQDVLREPDGVIWIGTELFATADEGDLDGGSRGWTVFDPTVRFFLLLLFCIALSFPCL
jgi:hypothetical protein